MNTFAHARKQISRKTTTLSGVKSKIPVKMSSSNKQKTKAKKQGNSNQCPNVSLITQTYDFPEFQIYKQAHKKTKHQNNRKSLVKKQTEISQTRKSYTKSQKSNIMKKSKQNKDVISEGQNKFQRIQSLQKDFSQSLSRMFKIIDIFNRGKISDLSISTNCQLKCSRYFHEVFSRIKQQRLCLSEAQFIKLCMPILYQLKMQQTLQIIQQLKAQQTLKMSINFTQTDRLVDSSPIQQKIFNRTSLVNKKNEVVINSAHRSYLNKAIQTIREKETDIQKKIKQIQQKYKEPQKIIIEKSQPLVQEQQKITEFKVDANFKRLIPDDLKQKYSLKDKTNQQIHENQQKINLLSYSKTFDYKTPSQKQNNLATAKGNSIRYRRQSFHDPDKSLLELQNKRLDRLSNKVQQYLRLNQTKLNHSSNFIQQNTNY